MAIAHVIVSAIIEVEQIHTVNYDGASFSDMIQTLASDMFLSTLTCIEKIPCKARHIFECVNSPKHPTMGISQQSRDR